MAGDAGQDLWAGQGQPAGRCDEGRKPWQIGSHTVLRGQRSRHKKWRRGGDPSEGRNWGRAGVSILVKMAIAPARWGVRSLAKVSACLLLRQYQTLRARQRQHAGSTSTCK